MTNVKSVSPAALVYVYVSVVDACVNVTRFKFVWLGSMNEKALLTVPPFQDSTVYGLARF